MPSHLTIGIAQTYTRDTLSETLSSLKSLTQRAAQKDISILLFPEAYLGGYPRTCSFGSSIGARTDEGREQFLRYFQSAVDLGDTPVGAGDAWIENSLPVNKDTGRRGDGTREALEAVARETGVFIIVGLVEKAGGSMFCSAVYVDPVRGMLGKRRKVMPTGTERLVWAQGTPSTLKAVATTIKGVRVVLGCAICWENYMPLLRYSIYAQGVNLYLAPTADGRDTWEGLLKTIACEGRCFVLSSNQCVRTKNLPSWISGRSKTTTSNGVRDIPNGHTDLSTPPVFESTQKKRNSTSSTLEGSGGRRKSMTTRTDENHVIAWRCQDGTIPNSTDETIQEEDQKQTDPRSELSRTLPTEETPTSPTSKEPQPSSLQQFSSLTNHDNPDDNDDNSFISHGGSMIVSPLGKTIAGPIWDKEDELIWTEVDFEDCERGKLDFDVSGHYARADVFRLDVEGLDLVPHP